MIRNLPSNAGDAGLIPGWGTRIPHARENCMLQQRSSAAKKKIKTVKTGIFLTCTKRCAVFGLLRCGKEPACHCRRHKRCGFNLWVGKIPWRRAWQPTAVFLPGESHGQWSLGLQSLGSQRVGHDCGTE